MNVLTLLINYLKQLEGVGERQAKKWALQLLYQPPEYLEQLGSLLLQLSKEDWQCKRCFHIRQQESAYCAICNDPYRGKSKEICVVADIFTLLAIEDAQIFRGKYHVLGKLISPLKGTLPEDTTIEALLKRLDEEGIEELIFALPASNEAEMTIAYIQKRLEGKALRFSQIAVGVPFGRSLAYTDALTLAKAFQHRIVL